MKKILLLNYEFPPLGGGAAPVSFELAKNLTETGKYEIDVVTMGFRGLPEKEEVSENFRIFRVHCWRSKKEMCHPWEQLSYLFAARKFLNKNQKKYDLIHTHFLIPTGILAVHFAKKWKIPLVITAHGSDVLGHNPRFWFLYLIISIPWKKICRFADVVVAPSKFLGEKIIKIEPKTKIKNIPNGIFLEHFLPAKKEKTILFVGRLNAGKGVDVLLRALEKVDLKNWKIQIVGDGPERKNLEKFSLEKNIPVEFFGWLDRKKCAEFFGRAEIFVLPSFFENFNTTLLEAMCAECCVIATDVGGNPEIIGENGLLVSPKNSDELANAITKILNDHDLRGVFQKKARKRIEENFSWKAVSEKYDHLFSKFFR